jgi:hypothetical protein
LRYRTPANSSVISIASLAVAALLSACSAASPTAGSRAAATVPSSAAVRPARAADAFTVAGTRAVQPNGSQDTNATAPTPGCNAAALAADKALGARVAAGFAVASFPASADLLKHFLAGRGTPVSYRAGSPISRRVLASSAFMALNRAVQTAVVSQLRAGRTRVELAAAQLPAVAFESKTSDLYWGFRGTQGLTVTGRGRREHGRFVGSLTYVIRDSYGFPANDTLGGIGTRMRYLQTVCGAPQHPGGAHWFPDSITVTVPFNRRA